MKSKKVKHTLPPIYDAESKVLLLGSMPSVKSREVGFYYGHKMNNFWQVLSIVYQEDIPEDIPGKIAFLKKHHIALYDVIKSCEICGSSDSSIKKIVPNNLKPILKNSQIEKIYTLGRKAKSLYDKYIYPKIGIEAIYLPSTSPANCKKGIMLELVKEFSQLKEITEK